MEGCHRHAITFHVHEAQIGPAMHKRTIRSWLFSLVMMAAALPHAGAAFAQASAPVKLVVFTGPTPLYDAVWMADARGFYKAEGLDVEFRLFPTGATALQTFKTGQGEIVFTGDLPGVSYWANNNQDYQMITVLERDSKGYVAIAKKSITKAEDLKGKVIATRVGANGSYFITEYLKKNGLKPTDVTIKNLDGQTLPTALCQGDIDAFFIWQPFGFRALEICGDKVHQLSNAEGYYRGYAVAAARPGWLRTPEGRDKAMRFLRATIKGKTVAESDFPAVFAYAKEKYGLSEAATRFQWEINERAHGFDATFQKEVCGLSAWMVGEGLLKAPIKVEELIWTDGIKELLSDKVAPSTPC